MLEDKKEQKEEEPHVKEEERRSTVKKEEKDPRLSDRTCLQAPKKQRLRWKEVES
jgi:hypothetical protein